MKKVLVATVLNLNEKIEQKYPGIISAMQKMGYDVWYIGIIGDGVYLCNNENKIKVGHIKFANLPLLSRVSKYKAFFRALISIIKKKYKFDYCYFRCTIYLGLYVKALKTLQEAGVKVIVEIPTHPSIKEHESDKRLWRKPIYKMMKCNEEKAAKYVDLFALIGEQDTEYLGRPALNIENGVNMDNIREKKDLSKNDEIHFIAVAKITRWHGYDRFIEGLHNYKENGGTEKIVFHVVGPEGDGSLSEYQSLVKKYSLEENVVFHGTMFGDALAELFDRCDVAVACIAGYRKKFKKSSELKIREYMASGIPFIYGTINDAINPKWDYCLKISDDEEPIDIFTIVEFAKKVKGEQDISKRIRKDCTENMTWEKQMKLLFDYFEKK